MNWTKPFALTALAASLVVTGCADIERDPDLDSAFQSSAVIAVGDQYAFLSPAWDELWLMTPELDGVSFEVVDIDREPLSIEATPDGRIMILTTDDPGVMLVDPAAPGAGQWYDFGGIYYDQIHIDDVAGRGRYIVASYATAQGTGDSVLVNRRSVTVIDTVDDTVETFSLRGSSDPTAFHFADTVTLRGPEDERDYMLVYAGNAISIVNLRADNENDRQRLIPLVEPGSGSTVRVSRAIFGEDDPTDPYDLKLFVLAAGSTELYVIDIIPGEDQDIQPSINQVTTGYAADMYPFEMGEGDARHQEILVMGASRSLTVVNAATGDAENVALDRTMTRAILWEESSADNTVIVPRALLYNPGDAIVYHAELDELRRQGTGALRTQVLNRAVESIELLDTSDSGTPRAVVRYASGTGVGILNLEDRFEYPLNASLTLGQFAFGGDRLYTAVPGTNRVGVVDLASTAAGELEVPGPASRLVYNANNNTLLVNHGSTGGWMTIVSTATLEEEDQIELRGFLVDGILDREDD